MSELREAAAVIKQAEEVLAPDYSDVIHVDPKTWGRDYPAPTSRPWKEGAGLGDDDPSGIHPDYTNREWEAMLDEARANGQAVHLRTQLGRLRYPGNDSIARSYNSKLRREEKAEFRKYHPNGCPHCGKG